MDLRYFNAFIPRIMIRIYSDLVQNPTFFPNTVSNFLRAVYIPYRTVYMFKEINTFIQQGCINLIKSDIK